MAEERFKTEQKLEQRNLLFQIVHFHQVHLTPFSLVLPYAIDCHIPHIKKHAIFFVCFVTLRYSLEGNYISVAVKQI